MVPPFLGLVSYSERINRTFLFRSSSRREGGSDPRERKGAETAQAGKSVTKDPTLEEALDGPLHHQTPGPILRFIEIGVALLELLPVVLQTLVEGGPLGMAGPVGCRRRHSLPETTASSNLEPWEGSANWRSGGSDWESTCNESNPVVRNRTAAEELLSACFSGVPCSVAGAKRLSR